MDDGKYRAPCAEKTAKGHAGDHTPAACTGGGLLYIDLLSILHRYCGGHPCWVVNCTDGHIFRLSA